MNKRILAHGESKRTGLQGVAFDVVDGEFIYSQLNRNEIYFGIEIEVAYTNFSGRVVGYGSTISGIDDVLGQAFNIEIDGSVHSGFEIVSKIMTMKAMLYFLNSADIRAFIKDSTDGGNNGIHIHTSRTMNWTDAMESSYLAVMAECGPKMASMTRSVHWAKWFHENLTSRALADLMNENSSRHDDVIHGIKFEGRYWCLNLENENTVEFRFFNFTNDVNRLCNYIKLIDSINRVARNNKPSTIKSCAYLDEDTWTVHC